MTSTDDNDAPATQHTIEPAGPGPVRTGHPDRPRTTIRVALALATSAAVAAAVLLAWPPWAGGDPDRVGAGPTLAPASRAYPVLPGPEDGRYDAELSGRLIRQRQAFRQKVAEVLQQHLPPGAAMAISESSFGDYRLTVDGTEYRVVLYIDPGRMGERSPKGAVAMASGSRPQLGVDRYEPRCRPAPARAAGRGCVDGALPNGEFATVYFPERTDVPVGPADWGVSSSFRYRGGRVDLGIVPHPRSRMVPAITGEQWLRLVTDPSFVELVDYWRAYPDLKGNGW
ncbi:hypothetical protein [Embleya sp. NPDC020886]|uniref:hypothetical protein n=1 Tax=Embleya sp. NPDC020886 TaxID=3363980 RepID=UPI0037BC94B1